MVAEIPIQQRTEEALKEGRSPMQDAWREFRRNKIAVAGMAFIVFVTIVALVAPLITPYDFAHQNLPNNRAEPMTGYIITTDKLPACHWEGTFLEWGCTLFVAGSDGLGRDLYSRVIYGTRISLSVALVAASVSLVIGFVYGTVSGYAGGRTDDIMMRVVDFL